MTSVATSISTDPSGRRRRGPLLLSAAAFSLGGAAVYLAVLPAHLQANPVDGIFFGAAGIAQVLLGVRLLTRPIRRLLVAAAAVSLAVVAVWALARTTGLPGPNPWQPLDTAIGFTDVLCAILEGIAVVLLGWAAARWPYGPRVRRPVLVVLACALPLLLAVLLTVAGVAFATDGFTSVTLAHGPVPAGLPAGRVTTVTYCSPRHTKLAMDLYAPPAGAARPSPVALYVHGGGFIFGDRKLHGLGAKQANHAGALLPRLRDVLTRRGFVVASIDYRMPPLTPWPAAVEDAKCAVRFLRAHAAALGIDPGRIGAWGSSAGGTAVCLLGLAGPTAGFDQGQDADQSSAVQAVVDMFGPSDLTDFSDSEPFARLVLRVALGGSAAARRSASPLTYVPPSGAAGSGVPPFLILHGADDRGIRPRHSQELARRLRAAGMPVDLVLVKGTGHTLDTPSEQPTPDQLTQLVADFLTRTLAIERV